MLLRLDGGQGDAEKQIPTWVRRDVDAGPPGSEYDCLGARTSPAHFCVPGSNPILCASEAFHNLQSASSSKARLVLAATLRGC